MKTRRSLRSEKVAGNEKTDEKNEEICIVSTVRSLPIIRTLRSRTITSDTEDEVARSPRKIKRKDKTTDEPLSDEKDTSEDSKCDLHKEVISPKSSRKRQSAHKLSAITEIKEDIETEKTEITLENEETEVKLVNEEIEIKLENEEIDLKLEKYELDSSDADSADEGEREIIVGDEEKEETEIKEEVEDFDLYRSSVNEDLNVNDNEINTSLVAVKDEDSESTEEKAENVNKGRRIERSAWAISTEKPSSVSSEELKGNLSDDTSLDDAFNMDIKIVEIKSVDDSQVLKRKPSVSPKKTTLMTSVESHKDSSNETSSSHSSMKNSSDVEDEHISELRERTPSKSCVSPRKTPVLLIKEPHKDSSNETSSSDSSMKNSSDIEDEHINKLRERTPSKSPYVSPRKTPVLLTKKQVENLDDDMSSNDGSSKNSVCNEENKDEGEEDDDSDDEMPEAISFESGRDQINQVLTMAAEAIRKEKQKKKEEMKKRIEMMRVQKAEKERKRKEKLKQLEANLPPRLNEDVVNRLQDTPEIPIIRDVEPQQKKRKKELFEKVAEMNEPRPSKKNKINKFDDYIPLSNVEGSTKFGVVPLEVTMKIPKSSSESAAEFKRQALFGSRIVREPAKNQLTYKQKLAACGKDRHWGNSPRALQFPKLHHM